MISGTIETIGMVLISTSLAYVLGIPMGIILYITSKDGLCEQVVVNHVLGTIVNFLRAVPFIILLIAISPFTRLVVGTTIGMKAIIVPLFISAAPFVGRMVESSLKEIDAGVIEAAQAMGSSPMQIIVKVLLPEAKPSLILGAVITCTTILGYSAMSGFVGGGGLGAIAVQYGYYKYKYGLMIITVILLVALVQVFQAVGTRIAKKTDKRIRNN
ncbi:MAG: methionine ABC transporter permease [Eubacteriales bacterium]